MARWITLDGLRAQVGSPAYKWLIKNKKALAGFVAKAKPKRSLNSKALALAAKQIGIKESPAGSNRQKFGVWFGANGVPWCAIFVSWVLSHVGHPFKQASVPEILALARDRKDGLSTIPFGKVGPALKAGKVVLAAYDWPGESPGVPDHVEFVVKPLSGVSFQSIGGNTSPDDGGNQSNGGEVCRKTRYTSDVEAFILVS